MFHVLIRFHFVKLGCESADVDISWYNYDDLRYLFLCCTADKYN